MLLRLVTCQIKAGREAEWEALIGPLAGVARRHGARSWRHVRSQDDPRRYLLVAEWPDRDAHARFEASPEESSARQRALAELIEGPVRNEWLAILPDGAEPPSAPYQHFRHEGGISSTP